MDPALIKVFKNDYARSVFLQGVKKKSFRFVLTIANGAFYYV